MGRVNGAHSGTAAYPPQYLQPHSLLELILMNVRAHMTAMLETPAAAPACSLQLERSPILRLRSYIARSWMLTFCWTHQ